MQQSCVGEKKQMEILFEGNFALFKPVSLVLVFLIGEALTLAYLMKY